MSADWGIASKLQMSIFSAILIPTSRPRLFAVAAILSAAGRVSGLVNLHEQTAAFDPTLPFEL
jgi:hypothetical protein